MEAALISCGDKAIGGSDGEKAAVSIDLDSIVEFADENEGTIIISHVHPTKSFEPSQADIDATMEIFNATGGRVYEHWIFASNGVYSVRLQLASGWEETAPEGWRKV